MKKKKVAWLSPFGPNSSIGEFSHTLLELAHKNYKIRENFEFTIFANINGETYKSNWPILDLKNFTLDPQNSGRLLNAMFDIIVFNFGNNVENHSHIFEMANYCQGVAILHDAAYQHYIANKIFEVYQSPNAYVYAMAKYHGKSALEIVALSNICSQNLETRFAPWDSPFSSIFSLTDAIVDNPNIKGVITNSAYTLSKIHNYKGPALNLKLPGDEKNSISPLQWKEWAKKTSYKELITICSFGNIQRSKKIEIAIEALAKYPKIKDQARYLIAGKSSDKNYINELRSLIDKYNLGDCISIEVDVSPSRLMNLKIEADIFINIRHPNIEGGSGSLIEQLASGKPVIAMRSGCFSEIDNKILTFIEPSDSCHELALKLDMLVNNSALRIKLGKASLKYANSYKSDEYLQDLLKFANDAKDLDIASGNVVPTSGMHLDRILVNDVSIRNPSFLETYDPEMISIYIDIIFDDQMNLNPGKYLSQVKDKNLPLSIELYDISRTAALINKTSVDLATHERWRLPKKIPIEYLIYISHFSTQNFINLLIGICENSNLASLKDALNNAFSRISFKTLSDRLLLVNSLIHLLPTNEILTKKIGIDLGVNMDEIQSRTKIVKSVISASDSSFINLVKQLDTIYFDYLNYLHDHKDLSKEILSPEMAKAHYLKHGSLEGRPGRIKIEALDTIIEYMGED